MYEMRIIKVEKRRNTTMQLDATNSLEYEDREIKKSNKNNREQRVNVKAQLKGAL